MQARRFVELLGELETKEQLKGQPQGLSFSHVSWDVKRRDPGNEVA